jgi:hypothetical protein
MGSPRSFASLEILDDQHLTVSVTIIGANQTDSYLPWAW